MKRTRMTWGAMALSAMLTTQGAMSAPAMREALRGGRQLASASWELPVWTDKISFTPAKAPTRVSNENSEAVAAVPAPLDTATPTPTETNLPPVRVTVSNRVSEPPGRRVMGSNVEYVIAVQWEGRIDLSAPEAPPLKGLEFVNLETRDEIAAGRVSREYAYSLKPLAAGPVSVGKTNIYYVDLAGGARRSIEAPSFEFTIAPAPKDYGALMKQVAIGAFGLMILTASTIVIVLLVRTRNLKGTDERPGPLSPLDELRAEAEGLSALLVEGKAGEFFGRVAQCVRRLLSVTTGEEMGRRTTGQITAFLNSREPASPERARVVELLGQCDAVRFAAHAPTREECDAALREWTDILKREEQRRGEAR